MVRHAYDVFGEQVRLITAMGGETQYRYDAMGRTTDIGNVGFVNASGALVSGVAVYQTSGSMQVSQVLSAIWTHSDYDAEGNKIAQRDGTGATTRYVYDAIGDVIETVNPAGQATWAAYNAEGRETASVDQLGNSNRWSYDGFGQMQSSTDIGGATTTYGYDVGNNLVLQTSTRGQHLAFTYDQSGQLLTDTDTGTPGQTEVTQYDYDLARHHTLESTSITVGSQTTVYQNQMIQYDALGRVTKVVDNANFTELDTSYDAMGNTTHIRSDAEAVARLRLRGRAGAALRKRQAVHLRTSEQAMR